MGYLNIDFLEEKYVSLNELVSSEKENSNRYQCHGLFPYPAMMVPRLQGVLIQELLGNVSQGKTIFDPFMGSGTVLSESLARGADFYGTDINPLSLLCCQVKSDFFDKEAALIALTGLKMYINNRFHCDIKIDFFGANKWFGDVALSTLTIIHEAILEVSSKWCRRVFWIALAECVRKFSNTRLSTYKLHIDKNQQPITEEKIKEHFFNVCERNINLKGESWDALRFSGLICDGKTKSDIQLELSDARCMTEFFEADLVVTSPPYGDNQTTVTYGQFSYLPLQFIDLNDIDYSFDRSLIDNASAIDSASLGGSLKHWQDKLIDVQKHSSSLCQTAIDLRKLGRGGEKRLASFCFDLRQSLIAISQRLKMGGYAMITLGNRKINGISIPLDKIVSQFLHSLGFEVEVILDRKIGKKRMAGTMSSEKILIMRKSK